MSEKVKAKDIIVTVAVIIVFVVALVLVLKIYKSEGDKRSAAVSDLGDKDPNHIEVDVKLVSIDPNKGDIVARLEFLPKGHFTTDEGSTLARDLKLFVNSAGDHVGVVVGVHHRQSARVHQALGFQASVIEGVAREDDFRAEAARALDLDRR